jgi:hypothetical protein
MVRAMRTSGSLLCLAACGGAHAASTQTALEAPPATANPTTASTLVPCPDELGERIETTLALPYRVLADVHTCVPIDVGEPAWAVLWTLDDMDARDEEHHRDVLRTDATFFARAPAERERKSYMPMQSSPDVVVGVAGMDLDGDGVAEWLQLDSHSDLLDNFTETLTAYRLADGAITPLAPPLQVGGGEALFSTCWSTFSTAAQGIALHVEWNHAPAGCLSPGDHAIHFADHALSIE